MIAMGIEEEMKKEKEEEMVEGKEKEKEKEKEWEIGLEEMVIQSVVGERRLGR
jgi:hypothetical protein